MFCALGICEHKTIKISIKNDLLLAVVAKVVAVVALIAVDEKNKLGFYG